MRSKIYILALVAASGLFGWAVYRGYVAGQQLRIENPEKPKLVVLSYSSFTSTLGPAPALIEIFKKRCRCEIEVINGGDSVVMLKRLTAKKGAFVADLVIGLDSLTVANAKKNLAWMPVTVDRTHWVDTVHELADPEFVPFDWAPLTFIYRDDEIKTPPRSLDDLKNNEFHHALALQDPRTSTVGLQFVLWARDIFGDKTTDFLTALKPSMAALAPSWSLSYSIFKRDQAKLVFSYQTSVLFHWIEEKNHHYQAAELTDKHPIQIETAAIPSTCRNCVEAQRFINLLLELESQKILMNKNYMFPVLQGVTRGSEFENVNPLPTLPPPSLKQIQNVESFVESAVSILK